MFNVLNLKFLMKVGVGMIVEILRHARSIQMCFICGQIRRTCPNFSSNDYSI